MTTAISQFSNRIIPFVPGCPSPAIDRAVVDAARTLCEDTNCLEKTIGATGTYSGSFPYVLPFIFGASDNGEFYIVTVTFADYSILSGLDPVALTYLNIEEEDWDFKRFELDNEVTDLEEMTPKNTKFYRFISTTAIEIFPFDAADSGYTLSLTMSLKPSDGSTTLDDKFYGEWRQAVINLASSNLQLIPQRSWSDLKQAQINMGGYESERSKINLRRRAFSHGAKRSSKGFI